MARPSKPDPKYRLHRPNGQAVVTLSDHAGRRKDIYLGPRRSDASKKEYSRVIAEWQAALERPRSSTDISVNEVILHFMRHADEYYGKGTTEPREYKHSLRMLRQLYGPTPAAEFGPRALKAIRETMIVAGWCRTTVNARTARIKRMFKWAVSEEIVPPAVFQGLQTVVGLARGRSAARDTAPIAPVHDAHVDAVLPFILPEIAAMVELQRYTGMRPGEVCTMRAVDIDMSGDLWLYRPKKHKNTWRGKSRVVPLGPRAQQIVRRHLSTDLDSYLFNPAKAMDQRAIRLRAARQSKVQPSQLFRRKQNRRRRPGNG